MKKIAALMMSGIALLSFLAGCNNGQKKALSGGNEFTSSKDYEVNVNELYDNSETRECWLTIPDSELVINPFNFSAYSDVAHEQAEDFNRDSLLIDVGLLDSRSNGSKVMSVMGLAGRNPYGGYMYADKYEIGWQPDRISYTAEYLPGLSLTAYDYFYDEHTIVRNIFPKGENLCVWGAYSAINSDSLKFEDGIFTYRRSDGVTVSVDFSCDGEWKFYSTESTFLSGQQESSEPGQYGIWAFLPIETGVVSASLAMGTTANKTDDIIAWGKAPFDNNNFITKAGERADKWNSLLSKVPKPSSFKLPTIDSDDISEEDVKEYYYRSWTMIISNVLPANNMFDYRTISLGKASMWAEGATVSKYSCIWESLFATQMYSYVDPEIAWELCLGNMAIIPSNGNIPGESLPSIKAQTVWVCYQGLKDREKLAQCVEPLENYFEWRYENPRWILGDYDNADEKDIDFLAPLQIDLKFMVRICNELGLSEKAEYWQNKSEQTYENMVKWCYSGKVPVQRNFLDSGVTSIGTPFWIGKALWSDNLSGEIKTRTLDYIKGQYDSEKPFCGFAAVKYDSWAYNLYGMMRYGETEIARNMIQSGIRDVIRSGFIGELYNKHGRGTVCEGVRPSVFGAMIVIDCVWLMNGFMYHEGDIGAVNMFADAAGVENILRNGDVYSVKVNGENGGAVITKNGASSNYELPFETMNERLVTI